MDQKKKKMLNIPENKGLLHNFKFDIEIPFAPIAYPKTLYYQLDQERHTRPKVLNADVKGMCNLYVTCDLGLPIDDLNMKPHIYNLQDTSDHHHSNHHSGDNGSHHKKEDLQLHPDDLALINEDIIVSDTEEDEEIIKQQKGEQLLQQKIKEEKQKILLQQQQQQKESDNAKDKDIDFSQNFEQVKFAIEHSFTASNHIKLEDIKHPTDPNRSVKRIYNILPNHLNSNLKLGIVSHKQRVESLVYPLEKGRFCSLFKDISFQDRNQKVFRFFVQKQRDDEPYKPKTLYEEDMIDVESGDVSLFQDDPEVIIEEQDDEQLNHNQIKLKNKSVFNYSEHSMKLQANDILFLFQKQNQNDQIQNVYFQKVDFQVSLDQEKKELAMQTTASSELGRYVKMDIIDEEQIKYMQQIDKELVDEEFGDQQQPKKKLLKQKTHDRMDAEDDEEDDEDFDGGHAQPEEEEEVEELDDDEDDDDDHRMRSAKKSSSKDAPTKSYNLRESRNKSNTAFNQLSAEKKTSNVTVEEDKEAEEQIDDIFSDGEKENNNQVVQNQNNQVIEEEDDDEFQFGAIRTKADSDDKEGQWANGTKYRKTKVREEEDDFINDEVEEEEEEEEEDVSSVSDKKEENNDKELEAFFQNQQLQQQQLAQQNTGQVEEMSDDDEEFPL